MSSLEKIFTGILNNRLASLSDEIGLLTSVQAGFRNAHSTADNIFIWHSLIKYILIQTFDNIKTFSRYFIL
jgi:hypothetical protein